MRHSSLLIGGACALISRGPRRHERFSVRVVCRRLRLVSVLLLLLLRMMVIVLVRGTTTLAAAVIDARRHET